MRKIHVAVIGATGAVGKTMTAMLQEHQLPIDTLRLADEAEQAGTMVAFSGRPVLVEDVEHFNFQGIDLVLFAGDNPHLDSHRFVPTALEASAVVVDASATYRNRSDVPLTVPLINPEGLTRGTQLIATTDSLTTSLVIALQPLLPWGLKRIQVSASGPVLNSGTKESALTAEIRKILDRPDLKMATHCASSPGQSSWSAAVFVQTERPVSVAEARTALSSGRGLEVIEDGSGSLLSTEVIGHDLVRLASLRANLSVDYGVAFWIVSDPTRTGSAANAVQIASRLFGIEAALPDFDPGRSSLGRNLMERSCPQ